MFSYIKNAKFTSLLCVVFMLAASAVFAQEDNATQVGGANPSVTGAASADRVRIAAPSAVVQLRLEVYDDSGQKLLDTEQRGGNVLDWHLQNGSGERVADGNYLCVVTIKTLSGRLSQKLGMVTVNAQSSTLRSASVADLSVQQAQAVGPVESGEAGLTLMPAENTHPVTVLANNGDEGQLARTRGALTFRLGDFFSGTDREQMRLTEEGNLGIGTDNPRARIDVAGSIRVSNGVEFADGSVQTTGLSGRKDKEGNMVPAAAGAGTQNRIAKWTDNAGTLGDSVLNESGGGIELRSTTAGSGVNPLIVNPNNVPGFAALQFYPGVGPNANMSFGVVPRGAGVANNRAQFSIFGTDLLADATNYEFASLRARGTDYVLGSGKSGTGQVRPFMLAAGFLNDNATNNGQLFLAVDGKVGIGTTTPQSLLDVAGDLKVAGNATVSGNIAAKYQDIAEWVQTRQPIAAGTVVSLDSSLSNSVTPSARAYDTHVAGVVSAMPGVVLGQGGAGKALVSTTGRVTVMVDATRHPIRIGDLLVTSDLPGLAMRSNPIRVSGVLIHRPGTIIGKALEPLTKGRGKILVLLSLQ